MFAIVGGTSFVLHDGRKSADRVGSDHTPDASTSVASLFGEWGPTRGDRANDASFLAKVRSEWEHPQGHGRYAGFTPLVNPQGDFKVLWAGMTPAPRAANERAALVARPADA